LVWLPPQRYNLLSINDTGELVMPPSAVQYEREERERQRTAINAPGHH
jgi:hypothetical protein